MEELEKQNKMDILTSDELCRSKDSLMYVAEQVWESIHDQVFKFGYPIFSYRNTKKDSKLYQVVVIEDAINENKYCISVTTSDRGYCMTNVPSDYLKNEFLTILKNFDVDKEVLETYKQILKDLKNE